MCSEAPFCTAPTCSNHPPGTGLWRCMCGIVLHVCGGGVMRLRLRFLLLHHAALQLVVVVKLQDLMRTVTMSWFDQSTFDAHLHSWLWCRAWHFVFTISHIVMHVCAWFFMDNILKIWICFKILCVITNDRQAPESRMIVWRSPWYPHWPWKW